MSTSRTIPVSFAVTLIASIASASDVKNDPRVQNAFNLLEVWAEAEQAVGTCQCLLVVGTSAIVYPAAELIPIARVNQAKVIEVNLTPTPASQYADVTLCGPAGQVLPKLLEQLDEDR